MITAESYEGVVVLDRAPSSGRMIMLSVDDPSILSVPNSVTVLPFQNHGVFEIKTHREGTAQVFAAVDGKTSTVSTKIHSSDVVPTALLVLFASNKTKADTVIGYVLSVDARGSPATVSKDTPVTLRSTALISVDEEVLIKNGTHHAKFVANIRGSGEVFATAQGLKTGHAHITKTQDEATVRIAVAPNIILENSRAYFYVWLEKDGRPFKLPYVTHAYVSSSNLDSIRFNENPYIYDSILKVSLIDGVGSGTLISSESGSATITASVEGFGSAQTNVVIGPVLVDESFEILENDKNRINQIESRKPNIALMWIYPTITDSKTFGIVGLYHINATKDTTAYVDGNNTSITITNSINRVEPVPLDGRTITLISSSDLDHPSTIMLSESNEVLLKRGVGHNHAVEFQITGKSYGNYTISVAGPGLERFQAGVELKQPYTEIYEIGMTPIPALPHTKQDVAMFSVFDAQDALVDIQRTFEEPVELTVDTDVGKKEFVIGSKNTAVLSEEMNGNLRVVASAYGVMPYQTMLVPWGIADSVRLDAPNKVHIQEEFPYTVHEVDSYGNPLRKIKSSSTSATPGLTISGKRLVINQSGVESFAVISNLGADAKEVEAFANQMSLHLTLRGTTNRVNTSFELKVDSDVSDAEILVDSPFPYTRIDRSTYSITPNKEGRYNITVTALREGYLPAKSTFDVFAEKLINLYFKAIGSDGKDLHVDTHLKTDLVSKNFMTPYQQEIRPQFVDVEFPDTLEVGNNGYQLQHIEFGDQRVDAVSQYVDEDSEIVAQYQRMIRVQAENALGGGFYPYGSTVTLSVPPKEKVSVLVREVFDHWEGIPYDSDTVSFVATDNVAVKAILKDDYTFLMLIIGSAVSAMIYFRFVWKKRFDVLWYAQKMNVIFSILRTNAILVNLKKRRRYKIKHDADGIDF
ncbi:MAG TPA: hypothetical protein VNL34_02870 [Candidatus Nitrosotenuis sp.]|nr:hypothetical protein [Candidatus Nitrosotenuis sp.]